jgi:hypothetical protein
MSSKRFVVTTLAWVSIVFLVWHAINMATLAPESSTAIAAIAGSTIAAMVAAVRKYIDGETSRPSVRRAPDE